MRSVFSYMGVFVVGIAAGGAGCADILGLEPWEDKPNDNGSSGDEPFNEDMVGESSSAAGTMSSGGVDPCHNGVQDGAETGVDCGGSSCSLCLGMRGCVVDSDCASSNCPETRGYCIIDDGRGACGSENAAEPLCGDCMLNGNETDVDCGGGCGPCRVGKVCANNDGCWSGVCSGGVCAPGAVNARCYSNVDCASGLCASGDGACQFDSCCR